jgi:hypothetical protein
MVNMIVSPAFALPIAERSEPNPLSAVVLTTGPSVIENVLSLPVTTFTVAVPRSRSVPPAFGALYVDTTNVSVPTGASTVNVHVVPAVPIVQFGDVRVALNVLGAAPSTAIFTDSVDAEMVDG